MIRKTLVPLALATSLSTAIPVAAQPTTTDGDDDIVVPASPGATPHATRVPPTNSTDSAPPPSTPSPVTERPNEVQLLRERIERLEKQVAAGSAQQAEATAQQPKTDSGESLAPNKSAADDRPASPFSRSYPVGTKVSGYVQAQYEHSQLSEDQLTQSGTSYNLDRFSIARARLRLDYATRWVATAIELEGTSSRGTLVAVRRAEVGLLYRTREDALPIAAFHLGLFDTPFGYELVNPHRVRWFAERSTASAALFPATSDVGVKLSGAPGFVRYHLAFVNGQPFDDNPKGSLIDPNSSKDLVGRIGLEVPLADALGLSAGVSFLEGRGFHPGSPATKNSAVWQDTNENGRIDTGEVVGLPGRAATPSANFEHWALGLDLQLRMKTRLGWSELALEGAIASNLDRALVVADPVLVGTDTRELGFYASVTQQVMRYSLVGFRYDYYDPNADFVLARAGKLLPSTQTIQTFSPLIGAALPGRVRVVAQYDFVRDHFGRDLSGVPSDLKNDRFTLRVQGEM